MYGGHPFYRQYPPGVSYNPYAPYGYAPHPAAYGRPRPVSRAYDAYDSARARQSAEQRARRAQWLPEEDDMDDDMDDDDVDYPSYDPRERMYAEAKRRQAMLEQRRREEEEAAAAATEREREREQEWQEELERKKREDEERRRVMLEELRKERKEKREKAPPHERPSTPKAEPEPEPVKTREYTEEDEAAATRIQHQWRIHQSYKALSEVEGQFEELKKGFSYPSVIDFVQPGTSSEAQTHGTGGVVSVRILHPPSDYPGDGMSVDCDGKLAYTSTNYGLHQYIDRLDKLLIALDGIQSWGDAGVRQRRRGIVGKIEGEGGRIEWYWKEGWRRQTNK